MNIILIIIVLIFDSFCWMFSTSLVVNGENTSLAFKLKSIIYWIAIVFTFFIGLYFRRTI